MKAAKPTGASRAALGRWAAAKSIGATATAAPPTSVPLSQSAVWGLPRLSCGTERPRVAVFSFVHPSQKNWPLARRVASHLVAIVRVIRSQRSPLTAVVFFRVAVTRDSQSTSCRSRMKLCSLVCDESGALERSGDGGGGGGGGGGTGGGGHRCRSGGCRSCRQVTLSKGTTAILVSSGSRLATKLPAGIAKDSAHPPRCCAARRRDETSAISTVAFGYWPFSPAQSRTRPSTGSTLVPLTWLALDVSSIGWICSTGNAATPTCQCWTFSADQVIPPTLVLADSSRSFVLFHVLWCGAIIPSNYSDSRRNRLLSGLCFRSCCLDEMKTDNAIHVAK